MDETILKKCLGCGNPKALGEFYGNGRGGLMSQCRACFREKQRKSYQAKPKPAKKTLEQRFWEKVDKSGPVPGHVPEIGNCWVWTAGTTAYGYGQMSYMLKPWYAHRLSWLIANGDPGALCILHRCDNPACVRPEHLFVGSKLDNMQDKMAKGRGYIPDHKGEECYQAKLTDVTALEALRLYAEGSTLTELGERYGVTIQAIYALVRRKTWRHLQWP